MRRRAVAAAVRAAYCAILAAPPAAGATPARSLERCREHLVASPAFATDGTAFCAAAVDGTFYLYVTPDHARTWSATNPAGIVLAPGLPAMVQDLLISPDFAADRTLVVRITASVFYSTDAGATFVPAVNGNNFGRLAMTDALRGVSATPSHGVVLSAGYRSTSVTARSAAFDPALPVPRPLAGTGTPDIAFLVPPAGSPEPAFAVGQTGDTPATTQQSFYACNAAYACPDRLGSLPLGQQLDDAWFAPDFAASGVVFASTTDLQYRTHLYVSRDRARHFAPAPGLTGLLDEAYRARLSPTLVLAPGKPGGRTVFARIVGGSSARAPVDRLFRSDDDGTTWRLIAWGREARGAGATLPFESLRTPGRVHQGLLTYTSNGWLLFPGLYKGTQQVVWCSQDSGRTWRPACH